MEELNELVLLLDMKVCRWLLKNGEVICDYSNNLIVKREEKMNLFFDRNIINLVIRNINYENLKISISDLHVKKELFKIEIIFYDSKCYTFFYLDETGKNKNLFLENLSQVLKTPLNGVIEMINGLKDTVITKQQKEYIKILEESAYNLIEIVNDLFDYSNIENNKIEIKNSYFDLKECIEETVGIISHKSSDKNMKISYTDHETCYTVFSDKKKIKHILINILSHSIILSTKDCIINISVTKVCTNVSISIKSPGTCLSLHEIENLFIPGKKWYGLGLGLNVAKKLAELLNCKLEVRSIKNKGLDFYITIPIHLN